MVSAMRSAIFLLVLMLTGAAAAQTAGPGAPRQTLSVALPPPAGHRLSGLGPPGRLAVGSDGAILVATSSFQPAPDLMQTARSARIEVLAYGNDGQPRYRTTLPVQSGVGPRGFNAESLGVVAYPNGQAAVFLSSSNTRIAMPPDEHSVTSLFRLDASGAVQSVASVLPAAEVPGAFFSARFYLPTRDGGVLVGGGFGPDPFNWWIGRFDADGRRSWQAGPGPAYPEDVYGLALLPDGTVSAIVLEIGAASGVSQWYVARYAANGALLERVPFAPLGTSFVRVGAQWISAIDGVQSGPPPGLVRLDDKGVVSARAAWPFEQTRRMIAVGDGIAAVACTTSHAECFVVRADAGGRLRWQSPAGAYSDIAATPDGQVVVVSWSPDLLSSSLVRFADP